MTDLVRVNDEVISADDFVRQLKFNGRYDEMLEEMVAEKITIHAGKHKGIAPSAEEVQERADQIRRVLGLHRSVDMNRWLDELKVTLDDLEAYIVETLIYEKTLEEVVNEETVANYFTLNSPKFDSLVLSHIVVESEGQARELVAILEDEPDMFEELAREHSVADTRSDGGYIGRVTRGAMMQEVEAKIFNAEPGEVLGPFAGLNEGMFEIFVVNDRKDGVLDTAAETEIRRALKDDWLKGQLQNSVIELC